MDSMPIQGHVDEQHRLTAVVPASIPPGPVTVRISTNPGEDEAGPNWMAGIGQQWADELGDARQDLYTLSDGEGLDPT